MSAIRRTFRTDLSALGEHANLTGDLPCRRIVVGTRLHSRNNPDITAVLADERHATITSSVHRDPCRGRNGVGAQFTETGAVIIPAAFTVVAPALGAILGLRGSYCAEKKQRKDEGGVKGAGHGRVSSKSRNHWMEYSVKRLSLVIAFASRFPLPASVLAAVSATNEILDAHETPAG